MSGTRARVGSEARDGQEELTLQGRPPLHRTEEVACRPKNTGGCTAGVYVCVVCMYEYVHMHACACVCVGVCVHVC